MRLQAHSSNTSLEAQKIPRTWLVVADEKSAHIYCKTVNRLAVILDEENEAYTSSRSTSLSSETIHYCSIPSKKPRIPLSSFVYKLAELLDKAEKDKVFDRLIIIAPLAVLNQMRIHFSPNIQQSIIAELDKNLTQLSEKDLYDYLENIIWF